MNMSPSHRQPLSDGEIRILDRIADQLIPASDDMPSSSAAGVADSGMAHLAEVAPHLEAALRDAIGRFDENTDIFVVKATDPALFESVAAAVAGAYLTDPGVMQLLGYRGRVPLDVGDLDAEAKHQWDLTQAVRDRGYTWKSTPLPVTTDNRPGAAEAHA